MKKNLKKLNEHIFNALERLDKVSNDDTDAVQLEMKKCNTISQTSRVVIDMLRVEMDLAKLQGSGNEYADLIKDNLGLEDDE